MYRNLRWKILTIIGLVFLAGWASYPPSEKIHLGLDLQGGIHLVLGVQTDDALELETETSSERLRMLLTDEGIPFEEITRPQETMADGSTRSSLTQFTVTGIPPTSDAEFRSLADLNYRDLYDRSAGVNNSYTFTMRPNIAVQRRREAVTGAIETIERRVNEFGVSEPIVQEYGDAGDQIIVQLPGVDDIARAKNLISQTALLELKIVQAGPATDRESLLAAYNGQVPAGMEVLPGKTSINDPTSAFYLVPEAAAITGGDLRNARPTTDELGLPAVNFSLNPNGARAFARVTRENVGRYLAIIVDDRIETAPVLEEPITGGEGRISGSFTQQEVQDLVLLLRSGALPARLDYLEERQVGPTLGADSVRAGITASLTGLALVSVFMLFYYRLAGVNAVLSVTLNLVILLGFMSYLGAVMTLPGIAGFILTIGMGVDSNVLIFERIREELATKKGVRQALAAGFDRVFVTIVDTHVASLIAAAFLFQFGTGPIRGFATTLFFGLVANVFTAVFVSRTLFEFMLSRRPAGQARLSI
jgi:preprotein translocase subunit SecD